MLMHIQEHMLDNFGGCIIIFCCYIHWHLIYVSRNQNSEFLRYVYIYNHVRV